MSIELDIGPPAGRERDMTMRNMGTCGRRERYMTMRNMGTCGRREIKDHEEHGNQREEREIGP